MLRLGSTIVSLLLSLFVSPFPVGNSLFDLINFIVHSLPKNIVRRAYGYVKKIIRIIWRDLSIPGAVHTIAVDNRYIRIRISIMKIIIVISRKKNDPPALIPAIKLSVSFSKISTLKFCNFMNFSTKMSVKGL